MFPLEFVNLFNTIHFESFDNKEDDSVTEVNNTSNNKHSEWVTCPHWINFGNKKLNSAWRVQVSSDL